MPPKKQAHKKEPVGAKKAAMKPAETSSEREIYEEECKRTIESNKPEPKKAAMRPAEPSSEGERETHEEERKRTIESNKSEPKKAAMRPMRPAEPSSEGERETHEEERKRAIESNKPEPKREGPKTEPKKSALNGKLGHRRTESEREAIWKRLKAMPPGEARTLELNKEVELRKKEHEQDKRQLEEEERKRIAAIPPEERKREEEQRKKEKEKRSKNTIKLFDYVRNPEASIKNVDMYLVDGADINYQDPDTHDTPLMSAANVQNERIAEYLLHKGADPLLRNKKGQSAKDLCPSSSALFEIIEKSERSIEFRKLAPRIRYSRMLLDLVRTPEASAQKIDDLLANGADINYQDSVTHFTSLMYALDVPNERIAEYLLHKGADPLLQNRKGGTAKDLCPSSSPLLEIIKKRERCIELEKLAPRMRYSIMLSDLVRGPEASVQKIDELLDLGADINYQDSTTGFSSLMYALDIQNERIAEYLLSCGANPLLKNRHNKTARALVSRNSGICHTIKGYELLRSTMDNNLPYVKFLLNADNSIIDFQGNGGYSALLIAVEQDMREIVECLLLHNPNLTLTSDDDKSIFDLVTNKAIEKLLIKANRSGDDEKAPEAEEITTEPVERKENTSTKFGFF